MRHSGKIGHDEQRNPRDFYDRSIWEKSTATEPETLKPLMREGVEHSSVVCVLVGSNTWRSRWVKYEIARAVIDMKGLLAVHINSLPHVQTHVADTPGWNPLDIIGVYQRDSGRFYLAEKRWVPTAADPTRFEWRWFNYDDFTDPVNRPQYLTKASQLYTAALSEGARVYDYVSDKGIQKMGSWIDFAATQVGR